ncbi:hypothetical protein FisN_3Lh623 [Fistulifera solaris]|uniref:Fe-S metabolism associated domain-containing protein n=1 Tax=Fistulifera solaris TaxID=1519565 RepID=A0A1Z5J8T7_FISSO|nr:hypothetical protein FisN_3Lh623 [Fistulifera solaris]|eukprot:GAX10400.1 hypothetical protein FisN_3Lh623 [Fistulifera solaris]
MLDQNELVDLERRCARYGAPMQVMEAPPVAGPPSEFVLSDARDKIKLFQQNGFDFDYVATWYQVSVQLGERGDGIQLMQPSDATNGDSFLLCMLNRDQLDTLVPKQNAASVSKQEKNIFGQIVDFFVPKEKNDYSSYERTSAESQASRQQASNKNEYEEQKDRQSKDAITESNPNNTPQSPAVRPLQTLPLQQQTASTVAAPRRPPPKTFSKDASSSPRTQSLDPLVGTSRADPSTRSSWRASQGPPSALGPDFTGSNTYPGADAARRARPLDPWRSERTSNQMLQSDNMQSRPSSNWGARNGQSATDGTIALQNIYGNSGNSAVSSWTTRSEDRGQGFYADKRVDDGGASITETTKPRDNIPPSRQYSTPKKRPEPLMPIDAPRSEAMSAWTGSTVSSRSASNYPERLLSGSSSWVTGARSNKDIRPDPLQPTDPRPNEAVSTWTGSTYSSSSRNTNQQNPLQPIDPPPSDATSVWTGSIPGRSNERNSNDDFSRMPVSTELRTRGKSDYVSDVRNPSQRSIKADAPTEQKKVDDFYQNRRPPEPDSQQAETLKQDDRWGRPESNNFYDSNNVDGQPNWNAPQPQEQLYQDRINGSGQDGTTKTWEPLEAEALYEAVQDAFAYFSQLAPEQVRSDLKQRGEWYELEQFPLEILVTPQASVEDCSSRVSIQTGFFQENGDWIMYGFQGETESLVLRGLIQILSDITQEVSIDAVLALPPNEIVKVLGLEPALRQKEKRDMIAIWNSLQQQIQETIFGYSRNKNDLEYQPSIMGTSIPGTGNDKSEARKGWGPESSTSNNKKQPNTSGSPPPFAIWDPTSSTAQSSPPPSSPSSSPSDRLSRLDRLSSTSTPKFADGAQVDASANKAPWDNWTPPPTQDKQSTPPNAPSTMGTSIPGAASGKTGTKKGWGPGSSTNSDKKQPNTSGSTPPFAIWNPTSASVESSPSPSPPSSSPSDRLSRLDRLSSPSTPKVADGAQVDPSANKAPWDNWTPPSKPNGQSTSGSSTSSRSSKSGSRNSVSQMPKSQNDSHRERSATSDQQTGWKGPTDFDPNSLSVATSIPGTSQAKPEVKSGWKPSRGRFESDDNKSGSNKNENQPPWNTWTPPPQAPEKTQRDQNQRAQQQSGWRGDTDFDPSQPSVGASIPGAGQAKPEVKSGWQPSRERSSSSNNSNNNDFDNNQTQPPWNTWTPPAQVQQDAKGGQYQRAQQQSDWTGDTVFDPSQPSVAASIPGAGQAKPEVKSGWKPSRGLSGSDDNRSGFSNNENQPPWNTWSPPSTKNSTGDADRFENDPEMYGIEIPDFDPTLPSTGSSIPGAGGSKPTVKKGWSPGGRK